MLDLDAILRRAHSGPPMVKYHDILALIARVKELQEKARKATVTRAELEIRAQMQQAHNALLRAVAKEVTVVLLRALDGRVPDLTNLRATWIDALEGGALDG